jgi:hypothetical protein
LTGRGGEFILGGMGKRSMVCPILKDHKYGTYEEIRKWAQKHPKKARKNPQNYEYFTLFEGCDENGVCPPD